MEGPNRPLVDPIELIGSPFHLLAPFGHLYCPCREPWKRWVQTMKVVISSFGHDMVPKIFWVRESGQGFRLERTGIGLREIGESQSPCSFSPAG